MKMHLVLYYSNPNKKPQWGQILYKNAWRSVNFEMSFLVSSILPRKERKQINLRNPVSKVEFFRSFFGRIEENEESFRK